MNSKDKVGVCSKSFSKNKLLRAELGKRYKKIKYNEEGKSLSGEQLIEFLKGCTKAIVGLEKFTENEISALPELKVISKYGVGIDALDLNALRKGGISLGWTPGVNKRAVSELALSLMISLLRKLPIANERLKKGEWSQHIGSELTGKTVGVIGCGNVGKDIICLLKPFSCKIYVNDIVNYDSFYKENNINPVSLKKLLSISDVVTLHLPFTSSSKNMLNEEMLRLLKPSAILINLARGGIVDEDYLKSALKNNHIGGAAFDVFRNEPDVDSEFINLSNVIATPHIGGSSKEAILSMGMAAIEGLDKNDNI